MPYVHRIVQAGPTVEHKRMFTTHCHTKGIKPRASKTQHTTAAQERVNERKAEEKLRWLLNGNFGHRDRHVVLHYSDKTSTLTECRADLKEFFRLLRKELKKRQITMKYIACTETKRLTNIHHHIIINKEVPLDLIQDTWEAVQKTGNISLRPLDKRGNHADLASYLLKETRSTMKRYKEAGNQGQRYSCSKNLEKPKITYERCRAATWRTDPKPRKGGHLYKFKDGETVRSGYHDFTGWAWMEYFEILEPGGKMKC